MSRSRPAVRAARPRASPPADRAAASLRTARLALDPDQTPRDRSLGELRALLVLRQARDAEQLIHRAQVRLDRIEAEVKLFADLLVAGGRSQMQRAAVLPTQSRGRTARAAEEHHRRADPDRVAVCQAAATRDPLAVDERAVTRKSVVLDDPLPRDALDLGMQARDLAVPGDRHVGPLATPERHAGPRVAVQLEDPLLLGAIAQDQECASRPLSRQARLDLAARTYGR